MRRWPHKRVAAVTGSVSPDIAFFPSFLPFFPLILFLSFCLPSFFSSLPPFFLCPIFSPCLPLPLSVSFSLLLCLFFSQKHLGASSAWYQALPGATDGLWRWIRKTLCCMTWILLPAGHNTMSLGEWEAKVFFFWLQRRGVGQGHTGSCIQISVTTIWSSGGSLNMAGGWG